MKRDGVLAIDLGACKTGLAFADPLRIAVRPLETLHEPEASEELLEELARHVAERDIGTFLVGLALGSGTGTGERESATWRFIERLRSRFPEHDVVTWDEHLTTKEAESRLREAGHRGQKLKRLRDSWSAWVLLTDWLESGEPRPPARPDHA